MTEIHDFLEVLDAVSWINSPNRNQVSEFTGFDPNKTNKLLANGMVLELIDSSSNDEVYSLVSAYPFKGSTAQKRGVVREALIRMPLLVSVRQFLGFNESLNDALRKAAAVQRVEHFDTKKLTPILKWARELKALEPGLLLDHLHDQAGDEKEERKVKHPKQRVVFLSHHPKDHAMIRQIASDLTAQRVTVWLHPQRIHGHGTISDRITSGFLESDFFLICLGPSSFDSPWIQKELDEVLLDEATRRGVRLLTLKLARCAMPELLRQTPFVDFSFSYKAGLDELMNILTPGLAPTVDAPHLIARSLLASPGRIVAK